MTTEPSPEEIVADFAAKVGRVREEVARVIVGQRPIIDGVLTCLLAGGHALLEGVPGLGKTALVRALAAALDLRFSRIQFTPDLMPADILGTTMITDDEHGRRSFSFQPGPLFAHIVLADEINRTTPKTQSALLEAMQEHSITVAKITHSLEQPFFVLATQNPLEMEGTYPLPEAQLDRFFFKLHVEFPDHDELHAILDRTTGTQAPEVSPVLGRDDILQMRSTVRQVAVARHVQDFAVSLLEATHRDRPLATALVKRYVRFGASPRGAQACMTAARIRALFDGRFHAAIDDVREVAKAALRHRIILNFEGEAEGITSDQVLDEVLREVPSPG
ncbi:MAG: MoxR family ATPase [Myxococcales bacterium]|nr:MoxR family ATPase [Myxococcales bacterium]